MVLYYSQYKIHASTSGVVERVFYKVGDSVAKESTLIEFVKKEETDAADNDNESD